MSGGDWKDMFNAACRGDLELVRFHVTNGVDVDFSHPEYASTALVACALAGHEDVAHYLLDQGADPLLRSELEDQTPVEAAREAQLSGLEARLCSLGAPPPDPAPSDADPRSRRRALWRWRPRRADARH